MIKVVHIARNGGIGPKAAILRRLERHGLALLPTANVRKTCPECFIIRANTSNGTVLVKEVLERTTQVRFDRDNTLNMKAPVHAARDRRKFAAKEKRKEGGAPQSVF